MKIKSNVGQILISDYDDDLKTAVGQNYDGNVEIWQVIDKPNTLTTSCCVTLNKKEAIRLMEFIKVNIYSKTDNT